MRRLTILVVLLAMLWQSVALARVSSTVNLMADLEHAALHWQDESHHHHEDGTYHLDSSQESMQHMLSDHGGANAALLPLSPKHEISLIGASKARGIHAEPAPNPFLDGLLRPPRNDD
jgi:hypothetical protein